MSVQHTIGDVIKATSLSEKFIRKCVKLLMDVLKPSRGVNNALLFNNNAMAIFDQIAQKRKNNLSLEQIEQAIRKELNREKPSSNHRKNDVQTETNQAKPEGQTEAKQKESSVNAELYTALKLREELLNQKEEFQTELFTQKEQILERDRIILGKDTEIHELNNRVMLLEAPRESSPETSLKNPRIIFWIAILLLILALIGGWLYFTHAFNNIVDSSSSINLSY